MTQLPAVPDALTRGSAWLTLWDAMLSGRVAPETLLDLSVSAVPVEASELNLQRMLHDVERLYWVFLPPARRAACAPQLEDALRRRLDTAPSVTIKRPRSAARRLRRPRQESHEWLDRARCTRRPDAGEADYVALAQDSLSALTGTMKRFACSLRGQRVATATP